MTTPTTSRGTNCQACGAFRAVARNGKLPPHRCAAAPRPPAPKSPARKVIVLTDEDGMASFIRNVCYGQSL